MKWLFERFYRKDKGFTLIELLIVIIILAVLAGIAIPSYLNITNRAKLSATQAELSSIAVALEMYNADNGAYPLTAAYPAALTTGGYMKAVPANDKWGTAYVYASAAGSTYTLTSWGKDKASTGTDNIVFTDGQMTSAGS
jgi:general secretion pathway protein G